MVQSFFLIFMADKRVIWCLTWNRKLHDDHCESLHWAILLDNRHKYLSRPPKTFQYKQSHRKNCFHLALKLAPPHIYIEVWSYHTHLLKVASKFKINLTGNPKQSPNVRKIQKQGLQLFLSRPTYKGATAAEYFIKSQGEASWT